jgi:hypothetical protein
MLTCLNAAAFLKSTLQGLEKREINTSSIRFSEIDGGRRGKTVFAKK